MNAQSGETLLEVSPDEFERTVDDLERDGYRLLMIKPADAPREALLSRDRVILRLRIGSKFQVPSSKLEAYRTNLEPGTLNFELTRDSEWSAGRAGMMYRDLIPGRLGGRVIASHIRITEGGPVADRVHYHKIGFQVIYCLKGAIRVVYESQGEPFWLRPGDCVLQPPEIRHRVLDAEAGSEVIELTSPAEHETWFDHEMQLPNAVVNPDRTFGERRFVLHTTTDSEWKSSAFDGTLVSDTKIPGVRTLKTMGDSKDLVKITQEMSPELLVLIDGTGIAANLGEF